MHLAVSIGDIPHLASLVTEREVLVLLLRGPARASEPRPCKSPRPRSSRGFVRQWQLRASFLNALGDDLSLCHGAPYLRSGPDIHS